MVEKSVVLDKWVDERIIRWVEVVNIKANYVWIEERMGGLVVNKPLN